MSKYLTILKSKLVPYVPIGLLLYQECIAYYRLLRKYNASVKTNDDKAKMEYTLLRENHVIEKGMSLAHPRKGFGQQKVTALVDRLGLYYEKYADVDFLLYPLSTIQEYITYTKQSGVDISTIEEAFDNLLQLTSINKRQLTQSAGVCIESAAHIAEKCNTDFQSLLHSRHSIRYFTKEVPTREIITQALELAQRTPSACNRQAWHTHVYFGEQAHSLLKLQGGSNGFEESIHCVIMVTADMKGFLSYEPFQLYIDGGMYSMNLINALHSLALGTIPLSCGFRNKTLVGIKQQYAIPEHEIPIVLIGVGYMEENFKVAVSTRKSIEQTNTFH